MHISIIDKCPYGSTQKPIGPIPPTCTPPPPTPLLYYHKVCTHSHLASQILLQVNHNVKHKIYASKLFYEWCTFSVVFTAIIHRHLSEFSSVWNGKVGVAWLVHGMGRWISLFILRFIGIQVRLLPSATHFETKIVARTFAAFRSNCKW